MREAMLYTRLNEAKRVRCDLCFWRCRIGPDRLGRCKARRNRDGVLYSLVYGEVAAAHVDPIEKKPLFHFYPTSHVFSLGTWGCNYRCVHCQNWELAYGEPSPDGALWSVAGGPPLRSRFLTPAEAVAQAAQLGCEGICWTYNEPTVWFEYCLDSAKLAKERGLYTAYVTNGYLTREALDLIGPYLDAFRVDFKGFGDALYRKLAQIANWRSILDVTRLAKERWGMHVEVVTNVIPTLNDDSQLEDIAAWISENLGPATPWHVTAFHPAALLQDVPPTPPSTLVLARKIGLTAGLHFVYTGNVTGLGGEDTHCYKCGNLVIQRVGYRTQLRGLSPGGCCGRCGANLNIRGCP